MITNSYFEKIPFEQYYQDRLDMLDYEINNKYLSANGIFDVEIEKKMNAGECKFKDCIESGSMMEAKLKQLFYKEWTDIVIPKRGTKYSAGYDFVCPFTIDTKYPKNLPIKIPTGIRFVTDLDNITGENLYTLNIYPRSSTGIKKGMNLSNGAAIIDLDYCLAENSGHIIIALSHTLTPDTFDWIHTGETNPESNVLFIKGDRFVQGIIEPVYLTIDERDTFDTLNSRTGGIGSTGN